MSEAMFVDPAPAGHTDRKDEVLGVLRDAGRPLSVSEVATALTVHANTARFHLDGLVDEGLAERTTEQRTSPGRPRVLYASTGPAPGPRRYEFLAEMLTGLVATLGETGPTTIEIGKDWGRHLVERPAPSERVDTDEAIARLNRMLDMIGFEPAAHPVAGGVDVELRHCPFLEVAQKHTDVVCAIHLGLIQGGLEVQHGAGVTATALEPFVTPHTCIARLRTGDPTTRRP